jgi:hypothetical protein
VLLLVGCVLVFPRWFAPPRTPEDFLGIEGLSAKDRMQFADDRRKLQNDVRTTLLQALLQAVVGGALLAGLFFTWQQQQATSRQVADQLAVTRQGQVGERFSRAIAQLDSDAIDVRLGGLYELEQLARPETKAPERRLVIIEVLAAYIRQHYKTPTPKAAFRKPPEDLGAAFTIIGRRSIQDGDPRADLRKLVLGPVDLSNVILRSVDLDGADLSGTDFGDAELRGAEFNGADLGGVDLRDVYLFLADLREADLSGTDLSGVNFGGADLRGADLRGADLRGAELQVIRMGEPIGAVLSGARANQSTRWPDGFDWRSAGVVQE